MTQTDAGTRDAAALPADRETERLVADLAREIVVSGHADDLAAALRRVLEEAERRARSLTACFLGFGPDPRVNIERLVAAAGELLGAEYALYNRLVDGRLQVWAGYNLPPDLPADDDGEGRVSHAVIASAWDDVFFVRDLARTGFARTDPTVARYGLRAYAAHGVLHEGTCVGSFCVAFTVPREIDARDRALVAQVARAIAVEEQRIAPHAALKRSLSLYTAALESTADGILVIDRDGRIVSHNQKFATLWRIDPAVLASDDDERVLASVLDQVVDPAAFLQRVRALYATPDAESAEIIQFRDGRVFERHSLPHRVDGTVVGRVWSFRDITAHTRAEEESRRLARAVEHAGEAVVITDAHLVVNYANPATERASGFTRDEIVGRNLFLRRAAPPGPDEIAAFARSTAAGLPWSGEAVLHRRDGSSYEAMLTIAPVREADGRTTSFVALERDISTERRLREQLLQSQKMEAVGKLAGGIAHDFNNLLTAISGCSELLEGALAPGTGEAALVGEIRTATARAAALVAQLLAFSRKQVVQPRPVSLPAEVRGTEQLLRRLVGEDVELVLQAGLGTPPQGSPADGTTLPGSAGDGTAPQGRPGMGAIPPGSASDGTAPAAAGSAGHGTAPAAPGSAGNGTAPATQDSAGNGTAPATQDSAGTGTAPVAPGSAGNGIAPATQDSAAAHAVLIDPVQLEQILLNLVVNAREAMPAGGRLTISTAAVDVSPGGEVPAGSYELLTVSDTGQGMDAAVRQRIFEPFFTTKPMGKGTGLGLSTVYGIVRQCGGYVTVDSAPGQGATFRVYLPRAGESPDAVTPARAGAGTWQPPGTVLLVEDDEQVRRFADAALRRRGFTVLVAENGEEALRVLAEEPQIDVLVTDAIMPRVGGAVLAAHARARRPGLPVVFISGYDADTLTCSGEVPAGTIFVPKPFTMDELLRRIGEAAGARV